jgi:cold-inducible RNA-binding protein
MKIYVGNLPYDVTEESLRKEFEAFGGVETVSIVKDRDTGRARGFAFVEMPSVSEGKAAVAGMNGKTMKERTIVVNEARPQTDNRSGGRSFGDRRSSGGGYGDRRGGSSGGGGDYGDRRGRQQRY